MMPPTVRLPRRRGAGRRGATLLVAALTVVGTVLAGTSGAATDNWPMLQGGPTHTGDASGSPPPPLVRTWQAAAPADARTGFVSVVPGLAVTIGETTVTGFDPTTGTELWTLQDRARGPLTTPVIAPDVGSNGIVIFTEGVGRGTSALVGVDLATRERVWEFPLGDMARGSPTVEQGRAYVGTRDGFVYAVDGATGDQVWRTKTPASVDTTPAVA